MNFHLKQTVFRLMGPLWIDRAATSTVHRVQTCSALEYLPMPGSVSMISFFGAMTIAAYSLVSCPIRHVPRHIGPAYLSISRTSSPYDCVRPFGCCADGLLTCPYLLSSRFQPAAVYEWRKLLSYINSPVSNCLLSWHWQHVLSPVNASVPMPRG